MPASMMMPPAGSILNVSGSSSAMVAAGPNPGMMPTTVPRRQPMKHQNTLLGCNATANPCRRPEATSISESERTSRQRHAQRDRKDEMEGDRTCDRHDAGGHERPAEDDRHEEECEQRKADQETSEVHERDRQRKGEPSSQRPTSRAPVYGLTRPLAVARGVDNQEQRERHHGDAVPEREEGRARPVEGIVVPGSRLHHHIDTERGQ